MTRKALILLLLATAAMTRAANSPQLFSVADWQTTSWLIQSATNANSSLIFNAVTNQSLLLYLVNVPKGAKLRFSWSVTTGISSDAITLKKNSDGTSLATLTNGSQTDVTVDLDEGTYFLDFNYSRSSTSGGLSQANLWDVVLHLLPEVVPGSVVVTPGVNGITVEWVSDEDSSGQLAYGSSTNLGQVTALEAGFATNHSVAVSNWTVNVPLNFRIVNSDPLNQVGTNTLMRSFSIPALAITEVAPGSVRPKWISDAGQWELLESPGLAGPFNAVTNVPVNANITNSVTLPATNTVNYYKLQRTTAPGYVDIGP